MGKVAICDACKKPATIVAKLFVGPALTGKHSNAYTASADIGECCLPDIQKNIAWTKRKKYNRKVEAAKKRHEKPEEAVA